MISGKSKEIAVYLEASGDDESELDARILCEELSGERLACAAEERAKGKPLALILGHRHFYREDYKVAQGVLIPRADTEILVECAIRFCGASVDCFGDIASIAPPENVPSHIDYADICTGTGCVGISIGNALVRAGTDVSALLTDISDIALDISEQNAKTQCVKGFVPRILRHDILSDGLMRDSLDLIVSNPPYITGKEMESLDREVRDYEPELALFGGIDGLDFYGRIFDKAFDSLRKGGAVITEHGYHQGSDVRELCKASGFTDVVTVKDYGGNERVTFGRKNAG